MITSKLTLSPSLVQVNDTVNNIHILEASALGLFNLRLTNGGNYVSPHQHPHSSL